MTPVKVHNWLNNKISPRQNVHLKNSQIGPH